MTGTHRIFVAMTPSDFDRLFVPDTAAALHRLGTVDLAADGPRAHIPRDLADRYDVLVTSWSTEPFPPEQLDGARLAMAIHAAGSVRKLFPRTTVENGLVLAQGGAGPMAEAVAEMSATLSLVLLRNVHTHDRGMQGTRDWTTGGNGMLGESVSAQRIGIIALSRVGRRYAHMMRGLGAERLAAFDPYATAADAADAGVDLVGLDELCASSDVLCVAAPATPETRHLIATEQLARMPDGAILINTARSALIDETALLAELRSGRLRAGLDVFDTEPLPAESPFFGLPNVVLTPHVAGGTVQARAKQGQTVVDEIGRFLRGEPLQHAVTADVYDRLA